MKTDFFKATFGFRENSYQATRSALLEIANCQPVEGGRQRCDFVCDGKTITAGVFSLPSVTELHAQVVKALGERTTEQERGIQVRNVVGEARTMHSQQQSPAIFQAASQFNLLEFPSPRVTPEAGIRKYVLDRTQGPACAVACAAGTAYRNYLVPTPFVTSSTLGQTAENQINTLSDVEDVLKDKLQAEYPPWTVKNGYIDSTGEDLARLNGYLNDAARQDELSDLIRIGVQEDTTVTDQLKTDTEATLVTQTYNSAISIGYSRLSQQQWQPIAQTVLNGSYEATLLVGLLKTIQLSGEQPIPIYLTKVGGGVFQNPDAWIIAAIARAIRKVESYGVSLDVRIVHFGQVDESYRILETQE